MWLELIPKERKKKAKWHKHTVVTDSKLKYSKLNNILYLWASDLEISYTLE